MGSAWEAFFASTPTAPVAEVPLGLAHGDVARVRAAHERSLLTLPNVVGVAEGLRSRKGKPTNEQCIVVLVSRKKRKSALAAKERIPSQVDGVPVDVVEVGPIRALGAVGEAGRPAPAGRSGRASSTTPPRSRAARRVRSRRR